MRDQQPVPKEKVGAQQHRLLSPRMYPETAAGRGVGRVFPQIGERDHDVPDGLVADSNTLERTDPPIDRLLAQSGSATDADDPGRVRRYTQPRGI